MQEQHDQANLTVVAVVALVAVVGLSALVFNAVSLSNLALGGELVSAQSGEEVANNLAGSAGCWSKIESAYYKRGASVGDIPDLVRIYC